MDAGHVATGGSVSITLTTDVQVDDIPLVVVAV
jgi:hypothetical protein